jgi:ketosteroid isomerase-like protein
MMISAEDTASQTERTRYLVTEFYRIASGQEPRLTMAELIHPDIVVEEPSFFFQHGIHRGVQAWQAILPFAENLVDRKSIEIKSILADGDKAVAIFTVEVIDTRDVALIAEYWEVRDARLALLRFFPHDPAPYLARQYRIVRAQADQIPTIRL